MEWHITCDKCFIDSLLETLPSLKKTVTDRQTHTDQGLCLCVFTTLLIYAVPFTVNLSLTLYSLMQAINISPVLHSPTQPPPLHCLSHTPQGERAAMTYWLAISLENIIKTLLPQQRLPVFPWQLAAMSRWCSSPPLKGGGDNGDQ